MQTIFVSPEFPLNRRMRRAVRRGKLRVVREGGERLSLGGGMSPDMARTVRTVSSPLVCMADGGAEVGGGNGDIPFGVDRKTALELFEGDVRYWVPIYQRVYRWGKEQWSDFWEDVTTPQEFQYEGNIVLRRDERDPNRLETIDGQQRLTTIVLFAIAAIRVLASNGVPRTESPIKELAEIFLAKGGITDGDLQDRMRILPHSDNVEFLAGLMRIHPSRQKGGFPPTPGIGKPSQTQMKNAVRFFVEKFEEHNNSPEAVVFEQMGKIVFSRVVAEHKINPNPIFAALNTRGVPLSVPELVKNHFLSLVGEKKEREYDKRWEKLKPRISRGGNGTVRLGEKELPNFLRAVFICNYGYVRESRLFQGIVDKIRDILDVERFLGEMERHAPLYRGIVEPSLSGYSWPGKHDEERAAALLALPGAKVSNAFILAAGRKFSGEGFSESLRLCYAIGMRNKICGMMGAAQLPDTTYNKAAHEMHQKQQERLDFSDLEKITKGRFGRLYKPTDIFEDRASAFLFAEAAPNQLTARNEIFLMNFFKVLEKHLRNNQFDPAHLVHFKVERGGGQMRLGNWFLLEPNTDESRSRYETTRQTVGLDRNARQARLAKWAAEVPDWRIDCLEGEQIGEGG